MNMSETSNMKIVPKRKFKIYVAGAEMNPDSVGPVDSTSQYLDGLGYEVENNIGTNLGPKNSFGLLKYLATDFHPDLLILYNPSNFGENNFFTFYRRCKEKMPSELLILSGRDADLYDTFTNHVLPSNISPGTLEGEISSILNSSDVQQIKSDSSSNVISLYSKES